MPGARGPAARERGGKGTTARMANAAGVPALAAPTHAVLARAIGLVALLALRRAARRGGRPGGGTGGAQPQASPTPTATPAPAAPALPPVRSRIRLTRLACASGCGADGAVRPGALLRVRGTGMRRTAEVHFDGAPGDADDVAAAPVKRRKTSVDVRVPLGAATGPVTVLDRDGVLTKPAPAAAHRRAARGRDARRRRPVDRRRRAGAEGVLRRRAADADVLRRPRRPPGQRARRARARRRPGRDRELGARRRRSPRRRRSCSGTAWPAAACRRPAATCSA